jgi:hypothetical protein
MNHEAGIERAKQLIADAMYEQKFGDPDVAEMKLAEANILLAQIEEEQQNGN